MTKTITGQADGSVPFFVPDLGAYLTGGWTVERRIKNLSTGETGFFSGEVLFSADGDGLRYDEVGRLTMGGVETNAIRSYLYRFRQPKQADVFFTDGRFFHAFDLSRGIFEVQHLCGNDMYDGTFKAEDETVWSIHWRITGPKKNLIMTSQMKRKME